ncbi:hypothetical protein BDZ89DRAFT_1044388 [Hymenopellis radicata]|nr:hypothetical protein BDZ89DRAFT_1044388 [Hymenopellis radicata]
MATLSTSITEVWILTVANAIWSVLTVWDCKSGIKRSEWSPQGSKDAVACAAILTNGRAFSGLPEHSQYNVPQTSNAASGRLKDPSSTLNTKSGNVRSNRTNIKLRR